jgi:hypothetical protein
MEAKIERLTTLVEALAIHTQVEHFNSLGSRTEKERLAHNEAVEIIRREADAALTGNKA